MEIPTLPEKEKTKDVHPNVGGADVWGNWLHHGEIGTARMGRIQSTSGKVICRTI